MKLSESNIFQEMLERLESNKKKKAIILAGKTGVGKSTLINAIAGENVADVGIGLPVTQEIHKYDVEYKDRKFYLFDAPGFEISGKNNIQNLSEQITDMIKSKKHTANPISCMWYCIQAGSGRIDPGELDFIKKITEQTNIRVVIVLTQSSGKNETEKMVKAIKREVHSLNTAVVPILAEKDVFMRRRKYGIPKLLKETIKITEGMKKNVVH